MIKSVVTRLFVGDEEHQKLLRTLELQRDAFNYISNIRYGMARCNGLKGLHDRCYRVTRNHIPDLPATFVTKTQQEIVAKYMALRKMRIIPTAPVVKKGLCCQFDKVSTLLNLSRSEIRISVCDSYKKRIVARFERHAFLDNALNQATHIGDPFIAYRDGCFWLTLFITLPDGLCDNSDVVGIDLGIKKLATTSTGTKYVEASYKKQKRKIRFLKRELQIAAANKSKTAKLHLKKLKRKERNFSKTYIHTITKKILKENPERTIVLEDLSKIKRKNNGKKFNNKLSQIPFFMFRQFITYKAQHLGRVVVTVNPAYTSRLDHRGLESGVRAGCRYYAVDGIQMDADINAANNIRNRYLQLPSSRKTPEGQGFIVNPHVPERE